MTTAHPRARLDELIHQPVRFSLLAALAQADELEFRFLRDTLEVSDSVLSRQASTLEQAGYVAIRKGHVGRWTRTWLKLTPQGRTAFQPPRYAARDRRGIERPSRLARATLEHGGALPSHSTTATPELQSSSRSRATGDAPVPPPR